MLNYFSTLETNFQLDRYEKGSKTKKKPFLEANLN